jgi:hypothetical protein
LHKAIFSGCDGWIPENLGVVSRIDPGQTARDHGAANLAAVAAAHVIHRDRRSPAEKAQGRGDCKYDESPLSVHGSFLLEPLLASA